MPDECSRDPRERLVSEKYFSLRPKPLERWLWQQGLPPAAERVFWLHWEEGMRNRTWCSEIPLRQVARACCIDVSSVTRAYQVLKTEGLIRREDPGRDPSHPFLQTTPVTEVRIPRDLVMQLSKHPSRRSPKPKETEAPVEAQHLLSGPDARGQTTPAIGESPRSRRSREEILATMHKLSPAENRRYWAASRNGEGGMAFDGDTALSPEERGFLLQQLEQAAYARNKPCERAQSAQTSSAGSLKLAPRRLSPLDLARGRRAIAASVPTAQAASELLRQVTWAVEEGALRQFETLKALNIALKKIREGEWTRPNRMPPNWRRTIAEPEICSAA